MSSIGAWLVLVGMPVLGLTAGYVLSRSSTPSGRLALGLSALPYAGFALTLTWC